MCACMRNMCMHMCAETHSCAVTQLPPPSPPLPFPLPLLLPYTQHAHSQLQKRCSELESANRKLEEQAMDQRQEIASMVSGHMTVT